MRKQKLQPSELHKPVDETADGISTQLKDEIRALKGGDAPAAFHDLLSRARRVDYEPKEILYHEGNEIDTVYFVTRGLLKMIASLPNGSERIIRLQRPGSVLGLTGLRYEEHDSSAVALTPATALQIPLGMLQTLRDEDPLAYADITECCLDDLQAADTWITEFSTGSIRGRVARMLTFLSEFEPDAADGQVQLLTCEEMGSILGVTGESVSRVLADFKRKRILRQDDTDAAETYDADVERLNRISAEE